MRKIIIALAVITPLLVVAHESGINVSYVSLSPSSLASICAQGDVRYDNVSSQLQTCNGTNAWNIPGFNSLGSLATGLVLPSPSATSLGGVFTSLAKAHFFFNSLGATGLFGSAQPAFSDLSGSIANGQMVPPGPAALGGVDSYASVSHQWINSIATSGAPSSSQPAFNDISGSVASLQIPVGDASHLGGVDTLAQVTHNFMDSIGAAGLPHASQPAFTDLSGSLGLGQMAASNPNVGTFTNATVTTNAEGLITAIATGSTSLAQIQPFDSNNYRMLSTSLAAPAGCGSVTAGGSWVTSTSNDTTGQCTINIAAGVFSSIPQCVCSVTSIGSGDYCTVALDSITKVRVQGWQTNSTTANVSTLVSCFGPR